MNLNVAENDTFIIPYQMPYFLGPQRDLKRREFIQEGMFAFVSWKWVNPFVEWINNRRCLEVMAGRGILSFALRQKNVDIIATDNFSWSRLEHGEFSKWAQTVTEVEELDAVESVEKYGKDIDILIMSWPYMNDLAYRVIKTLHEVNPEVLIVYIGEDRGGCTADINFFEHFEEIEDELFSIANNNFERWESIHDYLHLGKYKNKEEINEN